MLVNPELNDSLNEAALSLVESARALPSAENLEALESFRARSAEHASAVDWAEGYVDLVLRMSPRPFSRGERLRIRWEARWARLWEPPRVLGTVAALLLVSLVGLFLLQSEGLREAPVLAETEPVLTPVSYRTDRNHREIVLADGSTLWLDWRSSARVFYGPGERRVELRAGRAAFRVVPAPERPFLVLADALTTRVTGTEFVVDRRHGELIEVAVLEGSVQVTAAASRLELGPSDVARLEDVRLSRGFLDDLAGTGAWRDGRLVLRDVALLEALTTLEPYSAFRIDGSRLTDYSARISGTYFVDRADDAIRTLIQTHRLQVRQQGNVLELRPPRLSRPSFR